MLRNGTPTRPVIHPYDPAEEVMNSPACHVAMEVSHLVTPQTLPKEKRATKWSIDDFHIGRRLGEGSYSTVILAEEKKTGFLCALKVIKVPSTESERKTKNALLAVEIPHSATQSGTSIDSRTGDSHASLSQTHPSHVRLLLRCQSDLRHSRVRFERYLSVVLEATPSAGEHPGCDLHLSDRRRPSLLPSIADHASRFETRKHSPRTISRDQTGRLWSRPALSEFSPYSIHWHDSKSSLEEGRPRRFSILCRTTWPRK